MLRASDVVRTASMQITVGIGFLVELDQSFILKHPVYKVVVFLLRACTPFDTVRSREAHTLQSIDPASCCLPPGAPSLLHTGRNSMRGTIIQILDFQDRTRLASIRTSSFTRVLGMGSG